MLEEPVSLRQFWRWTNAIERILVEDIDRRTTLTQRFPGTSVVMRVLGVLVLLSSGSYLSAGQESLERIQADHQRAAIARAQLDTQHDDAIRDLTRRMEKQESYDIATVKDFVQREQYVQGAILIGIILQLLQNFPIKRRGQ